MVSQEDLPVSLHFSEAGQVETQDRHGRGGPLSELKAKKQLWAEALRR